MNKILFIFLILFFSAKANAQTFTNKSGGNYQFTVVNDVEATEIKDQARSNTCWSFSTLSFLESELIRRGKGKHDLSEMFVVRHTYMQKARKYVRMHGHINFAAGGAFHDVTEVIREYGIMPEEAYPGRPYGWEQHHHFELDAALKGMLDALIKVREPLTPVWEQAVAGVLDAYLGKVPEKFTYQGKEYTPQSFASSLEIHVDDYVELSSFTHHPFYETFVLEVPDNWRYGRVHNLPLDAFERVTTEALQQGFSVAWGADVSEKGFAHHDGLAIVPEKDWQQMSKEEQQEVLNSPVAQKEVSQVLRQVGFDNYTTQDDHAMQLTGIVKDQNGMLYYKVKNSWGASNDCGGYLYASTAYFRYKTISIMVHKDAISKAIRKKLNL